MGLLEYLGNYVFADVSVSGAALKDNLCVLTALLGHLPDLPHIDHLVFVYLLIEDVLLLILESELIIVRLVPLLPVGGGAHPLHSDVSPHPRLLPRIPGGHIVDVEVVVLVGHGRRSPQEVEVDAGFVTLLHHLLKLVTRSQHLEGVQVKERLFQEPLEVSLVLELRVDGVEVEPCDAAIRVFRHAVLYFSNHIGICLGLHSRRTLPNSA